MQCVCGHSDRAHLTATYKGEPVMHHCGEAGCDCQEFEQSGVRAFNRTYEQNAARRGQYEKDGPLTRAQEEMARAAHLRNNPDECAD